MEKEKFGQLNWNFLSFEGSELDQLAQTHKLSDLLAKILVSQGITTPERALPFIDASVTDINEIDFITHPTHQKKALDRFKLASKKREKIMINGDPDADGISGTAVLVAGLRQLGFHVYYDFPVRCKEGHGLQPRIIDRAKQLGCSLVMTTDCGSKDIEAVDYANEQGLDVIICDHHVLGKKQPNALAMVNPSTLDHKSPYQLLSGSGVSLKFIHCLFDAMGKKIPEFLDGFLLAIASLGTISDRMSLLEPLNRIIVSEGVTYINETNREGLKALLDVSFPWKRRIKARDVSRTIVPRLNAPGRIGNPSEGIPDSNLVVDLLLIGIGKKNAAKASEVVQKFADVFKLNKSGNKENIEDKDENRANEAALDASKLDDVNEERKKITSKIEDEIELLIENQVDVQHDKIIVVQGKNWNPGVIGIDTDRLRDRFGRPAMIMTEYDNEDYVRGSVRSIPSINVYKIIEQAGEKFEAEHGRVLFVHEVESKTGSKVVDAFGGHSQACGFSLHKRDRGAFLDILKAVVSEIQIEDFQTTFDVLDTVNFEDIDSNFVQQLDRLSPYGEGFPFPIFCLKCCRVSKGRAFGNRYQKERTPHIEFAILNDKIKDRKKLDATGYGLFDKFTNVVGAGLDERYDLIFTFDASNIRKKGKHKSSIRLNVIDIKLSDLSE